MCGADRWQAVEKTIMMKGEEREWKEERKDKGYEKAHRERRERGKKKRKDKGYEKARRGRTSSPTPTNSMLVYCEFSKGSWLYYKLVFFNELLWG